MCLRCGVIDYPYRSWPSGPAGPGDYGFLTGPRLLVQLL